MKVMTIDINLYNDSTDKNNIGKRNGNKSYSLTIKDVDLYKEQIEQVLVTLDTLFESSGAQDLFEGKIK